MTDFGDIDVQHHLLGLEQQTDRNRGFLTQADREYLLSRHLEGDSARQARQRIRERTLATYHDFRHLPYLSDRDREQIFRKGGDDEDIELMNGVKEFVKFTYLGLSDFDADYASVLEQALREAEMKRATAAGTLLDVDVTVKIESRQRTDPSELFDRYRAKEELTREELAVLVNSRHNVDLADALYYQARDQWGSPAPGGAIGTYRYSWNDPDEKRAEEIVSELRRLFNERDIETLEEFDVAWERYAGEEKLHEDTLHELVQELDRVAPYFVGQMATRTGVDEGDMDTLHDIIWNPKNQPVERAVRPPTAGPDWTPADDPTLQRFVARIEVAREAGVIMDQWSGERRERWDEFRELVEFDPEEWADYMDEHRINRVCEQIEEELGERSLSPDDIPEDGDFEELVSVVGAVSEGLDFSYLASVYGEDVAFEAARRAAHSEEEDE